MDCAKNAWWQRQSPLLLAKLLGPPKLHSMEEQAVGIVLSGTWLPGSLALTEDVRWLAVYLEKLRWLTGSTVTVIGTWRHVWRLLTLLFLMEDGRGTIRTGLHIPEQSCVNNWFLKECYFRFDSVFLFWLCYDCLFCVVCSITYIQYRNLCLSSP